MADDRTPAEIEREIEVERAELSRTLDTLTEKFSMDGIVRQVSDQVSEHGGELTANLMRTAKETPAAVILTAIGVGWMIYGSQKRTVVRDRYVAPRRASVRPVPPGAYDRDDDEPDYLAENDRKVREYVESHGSSQEQGSTVSGSDRDDEGPSSSYGTTPQPRPAYSRGSGETAHGLRDAGDQDQGNFTDRVASADARMRASSGGSPPEYLGTAPSGASYGGSSYGGSSRGYGRDDDEGSSLMDRASDMWGEVVHRVQGGYRRAYASAGDLKNRLLEGTHDMDDQGRDRVAQARARAYEAQRRAESMARDGRDKVSEFYYEQPLVAGALAVAVGAVIGGLLPRTRREDEAFGAYRDQLFAEAESVFQEERHRAEAAARAALDEAKEVAREKKDEVLGRVPDGKQAMKAAESEAKSAAQRVTDAAREAHDKDDAARA